MAKESVKARQKKREKLVLKYEARRKELKAKGDYKAIDLLPRNSSSVRLKNRCKITGRGRGYMRFFGISRLVFRDMALNGEIPGVKKASW